jgi:hypothetical protein
MPKPEEVTSISSAWDYGARMCLRVREAMILWPPQDPIDNSHSSFCQMFSELIPFSANQIRAFELRHLSTPAKNISRKIQELNTNREKTTESYDYISNKLPPVDTIHTLLPHDTGSVTKASIEWLFGAILCLVLRDISNNILLPQHVKKEYSLSIYTIFSLFINFVDNRYSTDWLESSELSRHVKDGGGYHAASAASSNNSVV